ncbi:hypothetical protein [Spiroplasma endosymbiont of Danaus chrysippus]|uniref:hypothetical protein n=1 Tax=Spiroplasma endosymbiont of Danaus chrysippus TaxID=2691041 RepID=UPI00157A2FC7|nr:hypothetical protein [Spiroplasma endosymbiont of Danaus chrysippus]
MTNYLLSIDPSIKNTGFTLWEHIYQDCKCFGNCSCNNIDIWKPIWIKSYNFNKYKDIIDYDFQDIIYENNFRNIIDKINFYIESPYTYDWDKITLIIERGTFHSKNGIGYETQEHLRGFIAGQFNKLLTKDMLISPSSWKKWYVKIFWYAKDKKWDKKLSLKLANQVIQEQGWNITISNHDEADSLLIGWYYLNKEVK